MEVAFLGIVLGKASFLTSPTALLFSYLVAMKVAVAQKFLAIPRTILPGSRPTRNFNILNFAVIT